MTAPTEPPAGPTGPARPARRRRAAWLCIGLGALYIVLTPVWFMLAVAWGDMVAAIFWILLVGAVAAVITGIVLLISAARADARWRGASRPPRPSN